MVSKMQLHATTPRRDGLPKQNRNTVESLCGFLEPYSTIAVAAKPRPKPSPKPKTAYPPAGFRIYGHGQTGVCTFILLSTLIFILCINSAGESATKLGSEGIIFEHDGLFEIKSQGSVLKEILDRLRREYAVEIKGLEHSDDIPVIFSHTSDSLEGLLKALLRHLGEKNYAFEFIEQKLRRISVFPGTQNAKIPSTTEEEITEPGQRFVAVAEVQAVVEGSQAEALGVIPGDIIVAYDGVKVHSALQLVKEVDKKSSVANIEIVVIRDNSLMHYTLVGGFIGVRIQTKQIPFEDYQKFDSAR